MRCNFRIDQSIALEGEFGHLDVHNCYDLVKIDTAFEKHQVRFNFEGNEYRQADRPARFVLELNDVDDFEAHFDRSEPTALEVDEITFRAPEDLDYDISGTHHGLPKHGEHLILRLFNGHIRVAAASAEVILTNSNVHSLALAGR